MTDTAILEMLSNGTAPSTICRRYQVTSRRVTVLCLQMGLAPPRSRPQTAPPPLPACQQHLFPRPPLSLALDALSARPPLLAVDGNTELGLMERGRERGTGTHYAEDRMPNGRPWPRSESYWGEGDYYDPMALVGGEE